MNFIRHLSKQRSPLGASPYSQSPRNKRSGCSIAVAFTEGDMSLIRCLQYQSFQCHRCSQNPGRTSGRAARFVHEIARRMGVHSKQSRWKCRNPLLRLLHRRCRRSSPVLKTRRVATRVLQMDPLGVFGNLCAYYAEEIAVATYSPAKTRSPR
jgi:hypothetical protein